MGEIFGLPSSASWQDIKDFLRRAGNVKYTDMCPERRNVGIGGFEHEDEARDAVKELDGQTFTARDGEKARVDVRLPGGGSDRKRSRSRSRSKGAGAKDSRSRSRR